MDGGEVVVPAEDPGEGPNAPPDDHIHRLGVLAACWLSNSTSGRVHTATVTLVPQWHLAHRWRTGADVTRAPPCVGAAFQFHGDLLAGDWSTSQHRDW